MNALVDEQSFKRPIISAQRAKQQLFFAYKEIKRLEILIASVFILHHNYLCSALSFITMPCGKREHMKSHNDTLSNTYLTFKALIFTW